MCCVTCIYLLGSPVGLRKCYIILYCRNILTRYGGGSDDGTFADDVPVWDVSVDHDDDDVGGRTAVLSDSVTTATTATAGPETACGHRPVATTTPERTLRTDRKWIFLRRH